MIRSRRALVSLFAGSCALLFFGCGKKEKVYGPAPSQYKAHFETSKGDFVVQVHRDWAPLGADRFYELVDRKFYNDQRFFRVLKGFVVQWGINGDSDVSGKWRNITMKDDPVDQTNKRGTITFATSGPDTRTTQIFINLGDNQRLDKDGFSPFGEVVEGMNVVEQLYADYGEGAPKGEGPSQAALEHLGNAYLEHRFPKLDYIKKARIEP